MSTKLSQPTELIDQAMEFFNQHFIKIMKLEVLIPILSLAPLGVVFGLKYLLGSSSASVNILFFFGFFFSVIAAFVISIASSVGFIYLLKEKDDSLSVRDLFNKGLGLVGSYFYVSILSGVIIFLLLFLLIIPAIIYGVLYSFVFFVLVLENKKGFSALKRSKELARGYWWPIFWRYIFLGIIYALLMLVLGIPDIFIEEKSSLDYVWNIVTQIASFVVAPIGTAYGYFIYQELVKIKQGENEKN